MRFICFAMIIGFASMAGCESREKARRREMENNLEQVNRAVQNYNKSKSRPSDPIDSQDSESSHEPAQNDSKP
jgi:hypothetical protein